MSKNVTSSTACVGPDSQWKLAKCMQQLLVNGDLCDVHFTVGRHFGPSKNFSAHKLILAARSSVLRTMFYGSLPEKCQKALDIPDILPEAFDNLLSFMYTDAVENLNAGNVFATLRAADKYDLPGLVKICSGLSDSIVSKLNVDNCLTTLEQAVEWKADSVVPKCLDVVDVNSEAVLRLDKFAAISQATLRMILQRNTLTAEENAVYLAVERWAAAACARNDLESSGANRRQMLGDALYLVRFPLLTSSQLAKGPGQSGLLNAAEIGSIFLYHNADPKPTALAFPTERRVGVFRVVVPEFQLNDSVFVRNGDWWMPAEVTGWDGKKVALVWLAISMPHTHTTAMPDNVVRAADILQHGQPVHISFRGSCESARFLYSTACRWVVKNNNNMRRKMFFGELILAHYQVTQWKANNGWRAGLHGVGACGNGY